MKTTACLLVIVAALPVCLLAQSPKPKIAAGKKADAAKDAPAKAADTPAVPAEIMDLTREARAQFEKGNYREAEKTYDKALAKAPYNLYLLSNKGVVLFRLQKYKHAEEALRKAIAIAPEDEFCHCTLGIVLYQQGKFDEAASELTKTLAINPKNVDAHTYLGLVASQKEEPGFPQGVVVAQKYLKLDADQKREREQTLSELEAAPGLELNFDGPSYYPPAWVGDFFTPLERSRFRIPSGKYEPLRPIRDPVIK